MKYNNILLISLISLILIYCKKESYFKGDIFLKFSNDTIHFDTIFTTIGSTTKILKVYNPYNEFLKINKIFLAGGTKSFFRININGNPSLFEENVELWPKDSIYIFVEVTVDPQNSENPVIITDSIIFILNNNKQSVKLLAYGQDIHLINGEWIKSNTWIADKPYVIYNSMGIDTNDILTIEPGVIIYFHKGSRMYVWGRLIANGTIDKPITFRGDRLDYLDVIPPLSYDKIPGQWEGIWFLPPSKNNQLKYCNIRNAIIGIQVGMLGNNDPVDIELINCIITNHSYAGLFSINGKINAYNTVISDCGSYLLASITGAEHKFYHCTFANYYSHYGYRRSGEPSVLISNQVIFNDSIFMGDIKSIIFKNSIIYGSLDNELKLYNNNKKEFNLKFSHCLIKVIEDSIKDYKNLFTNVIFNKEPKFKSTERYKQNYMLDTLSPAKDFGDPSIIDSIPVLIFDIKGISRKKDNKPDLGAYEREEN